MFALLAVVVAVLAAFNVVIGDVQLGWLALALLSAHFVFGGTLVPTLDGLRRGPG